MPAGGRDAPLAVQAERLKKSQARRAERRRAVRGRTLAARGRDGEAPGADDFEEHKVWGGATGGVNLGSGAGERVLPEVKNIIRCELCGISVASKAEWQQHVAGVAHQKALARQRDEQERAAGPGAAAQAALEAAAWAAHPQDRGVVRDARGRSSGRNTTGIPPGDGLRRPGAPSGVGRRPEKDPAGKSLPASFGKSAVSGRGGSGQGPRPGLQVAHAELVRQASARSQGSGEPLSIGGWVPPSIAKPPQTLGRKGSLEANGADDSGPKPSEDEAVEVQLKDTSPAVEKAAEEENGGLLGLGGYVSDSDSTG